MADSTSRSSSGKGIRRDDWQPAELLARWGSIGYLLSPTIRGPNRRRLQITICLPYPDNKWPALLEHLQAYGIGYSKGESMGSFRQGRIVEGEAQGRKHPRPQLTVGIHSENAMKFMASIGWECGHAKRDVQMATWRRIAERSEISRRLGKMQL